VPRHQSLIVAEAVSNGLHVEVYLLEIGRCGVMAFLVPPPPGR
jgi:hypothetical protein